jgi:hypothetical protein
MAQPPIKSLMCPLCGQQAYFRYSRPAMQGVDPEIIDLEPGDGAICENGCHLTRHDEFIAAMQATLNENWSRW